MGASVTNPAASEWVEAAVQQARQRPDDALASLSLAVSHGSRLPLPAIGSTARRWSALTAIARADLTAARVFEAHTDALAILAEASIDPPPGSFGVFAAEAPEARLDAVSTDGGWTLSGTKPWCSLGGAVDHALVTAHTPDGRRLFLVDMRQDGVRAGDSAQWVARGLRTVTTVAVDFAAATARPVGECGWYLQRAGFAWGGIGVAACWLGGALGLGDALTSAIASGRRSGPLVESHAGAVDVALFAAEATLAAAAASVDSGAVTDGSQLATRVRSVVAAAAETTLRHVAHALGPSPLGFDAEHVRRVSDLELYVRQHHAEADLAALGALLAGQRGRG